MFSENNLYAYEVEQQELFERQLPYKAVRLPYKQPQDRILKYTQKKQEVERLREQILNRCRFEEMEYLEMLKKQREMMQADIKQRKQMMEIQKMEERILENKKVYQKEELKKQDALDKFRKAEEEKFKKLKPKSVRAESAYSSEMDSLNEEIAMRQSTHSKKSNQPKQSIIEQMDNYRNRPIQKTEEMLKEEEIKKLKDQMLQKYRFQGESGKKPMKPAQVENKTQIQWWINKVRQHKEKQAKQESKSKKDDESDYYSDTESDSEINERKKAILKKASKGKK